jgi:predicted acetyltransferase
MFGRFRFLDPFPLVDSELELVAPASRYVDGLLAVLRDPLTEQLEPESARLARGQILEFLDRTPHGRHKPDRSLPGDVPAYHFWMLWRDGSPLPKVAGGLTLRVGRSREVELYRGHIGYNVYPPARGHHFAERATRLVLPLAHRHDLRPLWLTCNPENAASRRTIERLGGKLVETIELPPDHPLRLRGESQKCRYRLEV